MLGNILVENRELAGGVRPFFNSGMFWHLTAFRSYIARGSLVLHRLQPMNETQGTPVSCNCFRNLSRCLRLTYGTVGLSVMYSTRAFYMHAIQTIQFIAYVTCIARHCLAAALLNRKKCGSQRLYWRVIPPSDALQSGCLGKMRSMYP